MPPAPLEVSVAEVKRRQEADEDVVLVDCREPEEFAICTIAGAMLLPMSGIAERVGELSGAKDRPIVVYCHLGGRSARVAAWLREQGFPQAQSMAGGIDLWAAEIEPGMARY
jgi:rhodanese-related sulfurtransferase